MIAVAGIVGPTASGKTDLAIDVAERVGAEIVCCDSMVVYRGLDVGTAKPSAAQRARVTHHVLDLVDVTCDFSVQMYQEESRRVLASLAARGVPALMVGGSGLYLRAALDPLSFPPTDASVRRELEEADPAELVRLLDDVDPAAARAIDPGNIRRVVRALEVTRITGRPFSSFRAGWSVFVRAPVAGLWPTPSAHEAAIRHRAVEMFDRGLVDEAVWLRAHGGRTATAALGYAEALTVVDGRASVDEAIDAVCRRTRDLARRQRAWFRSDHRVAWFGGATADQVVAYLDAWGSVFHAGKRSA